MALPLTAFSQQIAASTHRAHAATPLLPPRRQCRAPFGRLPFGGSRPGQLVRLHEAATIEQAVIVNDETKPKSSDPVYKDGIYYADGTYSSSVPADPAETIVYTNGNGTKAVAYTNGNGNGTKTVAYTNGNGNGTQTVAYTNGNGTKAVAYMNGSGNGATAAAYSNGNGNRSRPAAYTNSNGSSNGLRAVELATQAAAVTSAPLVPPMSPMVAAAAGVPVTPSTIEQERLAASAAAASSSAASATVAGTPYKSPGGKWSQFKSYSVFQRTCEIWSFAFQFAFKYAMLNQKWTYGKLGMTKLTQSLRKAELAIWLREGLVKLGPTFIKIGQQFSTRVDVLSPEFVKELEKLQDNVPPFDSEQSIQIIEESLGARVGSIFQAFDPIPIAAASLGQVHLATLRGEKVVIKVQRPGLKELFDIDLKNIRTLAVWLQKVDPKTDGAARDWVAIYDECSRILYEEIDYTLEGANADAFRKNFEKDDWVKVPKVYWEFTRSRVLVLEYCPGVKINDGAAIDRLGLDRKRLARLAVESYLQQLLRHGLFHADPHPGNVSVDSVGGGRLVYYDFGMMGAIAPQVKKGLLALFYGVYNKDPDQCIDAMVQMGVYTGTGDRTAVRRTANFFLSMFKDRLEQQRAERLALGNEYNKEFKAQRTKDEAKARRKQILSSIGEDLLLAAADQPFRFPAAFTFVVRSFTVLDGIGKSLDPRFDISEIAAPYARELVLDGSTPLERLGQEFNKRLNVQNRAVANLFKNPNKIEGVAATLERLERGDVKLRVRALEAERALTRVIAWQRVVVGALIAALFVNVGTVLSVSALSRAATLSFVGATAFGVMFLKDYILVRQLEKKEAQLVGA